MSLHGLATESDRQAQRRGRTAGFVVRQPEAQSIEYRIIYVNIFLVLRTEPNSCNVKTLHIETDFKASMPQLALA